MAPRITNAQIQSELSETRGLLAQVIGMLGGQHATPAPVVEVVEQTAPAEVTPEPTPEPEPSASDKLLAFVAEKGLAFAKGGRTYLDADMLKAQVRVLKTGKPEVLAYQDSAGKLLKRGVTHIAIGRSDDGKSTFTQFVYSPSRD
jgi:hypothetical protein